MSFLTADDFKTRLFPEIFNAITRNDQDTIDLVVEQTVSTMRNSFSRYKADEIFGAAGPSRNGHIVKLAVNISVYELLKRSNPRAITQDIKDDYAEANDWLNGINSGKYDAGDLPFLDDAEGNTDIYGPVKWNSIERTGYSY
jgi:phage gp36-like protein